MRVLVAGSAAGGGVPQWNCGCENCAAARAAGSDRRHASIAIRGEAAAWYLVNATPDVRQQIAAFPALHPGPEPRTTPIRGVLLTDAELDHTIGLLVLREGARFEVLGAGCVLDALKRDFPVRGLLERFGEVSWTELELGERAALDGLAVTPIVAGERAPRFARGRRGPWTVAYRFEDSSGHAVVYAPCVGRWSDELRNALSEADCAFVDGTFWSDDELSAAGGGERTAAEMGHVPLDTSIGELVAAGARRVLLTHVNNTNPILRDGSPEARELRAQGLEIAAEGLELEL